MIPLPCLERYLIDLACPGTIVDTARKGRARRPLRDGSFCIENVLCFSPSSECGVGRFDLISQTLQAIDTSQGIRIRTLCEADYAVPKSLGSVPRSGTRVNCIADEVGPALRAQGWGNPCVILADMAALEIFVGVRFHASESMHEWQERIVDSRSLLDGLTDAGFDVRPDLERFLANART